MRTKLVVLVPLVAFAALACLPSVAAAAPGPYWGRTVTTTHVAKPVPVADLIPKTAVMLPSATYPWVQPVWTSVHGIVLPTLPKTLYAANTQPPAWIVTS